MSTHRTQVLLGTSILAFCIIAGVWAKSLQAPSDSALIADLLKIEALPGATQIVEIRKDLSPDIAVEAHLVIPPGSIEKLLWGIPLEELTAEPSTRYGVVMTRRWERHFSNADFQVECDDTGKHVYVYCVVE